MVSVNVDTTTPSGSSSTSTSNVVGLATPSDRVSTRQALNLEEILIVLVIVVIWVFAVMAFLRKWDSIRIMEPMEPRYKHSPKNLESIKIVKRPQDSIIYKNYSRKMSVTMVEREKRRLQRMNTEPCLGVKPIVRPERLPTIHMEEATSEM